jgi:hypothetical protein
MGSVLGVSSLGPFTHEYDAYPMPVGVPLLGRPVATNVLLRTSRAAKQCTRQAGAAAMRSCRRQPGHGKGLPESVAGSSIACRQTGHVQRKAWTI